jgi:hypothetical protein
MYDIFYVSKNGGNDEDWKKIKSSYPLAQKLSNIKTYEEIKSKAFTKMFWVIWDDLILDDSFDLTSYNVTKWDNMYVHVFKNGEHFDGICLFPKSQEISNKEFDYRFFAAKKEIDIIASHPKQYNRYSPKSYEEYLSITDDMFWIIWPEITVTNESIFDLYFSKHNAYDRKENHMFKHYFNGEETYINGIVLCSKEKKMSQREFKYRFLTEKKEHDILASKLSPYDVVFISYNEPTADKNFKDLLTKCPRANRVHGVKGIHQAHIKAAELCQTDMIWIVDGDAVVVDNFDFEYLVPEAIDKRTVRVWRSKNPINDLEYGYGGVKLLPREMTLNMDVTSTDMTTSIGEFFKAVDSVSNLTSFNTDPFNTWKSAFRECCKLSSKVIDRQDDNETTHRLEVWCTVGEDKPYGKYSIIGARMGKEFGLKNKNNPTELKKINDFDWLKELFDDVK